MASPARPSDHARLLWVTPVVTIVVVTIELMMTGRLDASGWTDLAISLSLSVLAIQIAVRWAGGHIALVGLAYVACFTLVWYALTFFALGQADELKTSGTWLVRDGALTPEGHFHFLSRPFRFAAFTLLLSLMAVWGLSGGGRKSSE